MKKAKYLAAEEIDASIKDGTLWDGMTMAAWALAKAVFPEARIGLDSPA